MLPGHGDAGSVAAAPQQLIKAMVNRAPALRNVEIVHLRTVLHVTAAADDRPFFLLTLVGSADTEGPAEYAKPEYDR